MMESFENGYAVVIGVDDNQVKPLALPTVALDINAVRDVLVHPTRCAYKPGHVRVLSGAESTRANILSALEWLREQAAADPNATAMLYYSGHGAVHGDDYFLIPYDVRLETIYDDAIRAGEFHGRIGAILAKRLLVVLDCCHAAGVSDSDATGLESFGDALPISGAAFPIDLLAGGETANYGSGGLESLSDMLFGEGRAVLNSSAGDQKSYLRLDRAMSLFTYHFIEALTGHAPHLDDATVVYVTDVMSYVTHEVRKSAAREGRNQTPVMATSGVFPVAMLLGGKGVSSGPGAAPDPLAPLP